jgi:hypothetical protein
MGKRIGHHIPPALHLQAVVADGGRRLQSGFHVAGLDRSPTLVGVIGPDAAEAVGLQLDTHLNAVCLGSAI